jgi:hypothetical protein
MMTVTEASDLTFQTIAFLVEEAAVRGTGTEAQ